MIKLKQKLFILLFVLFVVNLVVFSNIVAFGTTTDLYRLKYIYVEETTDYTTGKRTLTHGTLSLVVSIYLSGSNNTSKYKNVSDNIFNFSDIKIECSGYEGGSKELKIKKGDVVISSTTNTYSGTLSDGEYTLIFQTSKVTYRYDDDLLPIEGTTITCTSIFTIDTTSPQVDISCGDNSFTNNNVLVAYSDNLQIKSAEYSKDSSEYVAFATNTTFTDEGSYSIRVKDTAGNITTKQFTIDKTPPTGTLYGVSNGGSTNSNVSFAWSDNDAIAILDGNIYSSSSAILAEGNHTIVLIDKASNSTTYTFTIDKTPPTGILNGVANGGHTNKNVNFTWSEYGATATLNGNSYNSGTIISAEGNHSIVLVDRVGNSITYTFTIDKTPPIGTLNGVANGGYTNSNVTFTWNESGVTATLNGNSYNSGGTISAEGGYAIVLTDRANNSAIYTFTIDKTPPTGSLNGVANGGYTNSNVNFTWSDSNATATLNGNSYNSGSTISAENNYAIVLTDKAGNSTAYSFLIDKTPPTGSLNGVTNGGYTSGNVTFTWDEYGATATLNGNGYNSGSTISVEGGYAVVLTDRANNSTTYSFTIDRTPPIGTLSGVEDGGYTNGNVLVSWSESGITATLDNATYSSGRLITLEGRHTVVLKDKANNTTTYSFTIDKTPPTINTFKSFTNTTFTMTAVDAQVNVAGWEYSLNCGETMRINEESITISGGAESNGLWQFRVFDKLGNTSNWVTVNFAYRGNFGNSTNIYNSYFIPTYYIYGNLCDLILVIDRTPPKITLNGVEKNNATNKEVKVEMQEFVEAYYRLNDSEKKLFENGFTFNDEGSYLITASDIVGNTTTVTFSIDRYVKVTSSIELSDEQIITGAISFKFSEEVTTKLYRDEEEIPYNRGDISEVGKYRLVVLDSCGNEKTFTFSILPKKAKEYSFTIPQGYALTATLDGKNKDIQQNDNTVSLSDKGNYTLSFFKEGIEWKIDLEVDNIAPQVQFKTMRTSITLFNPNKEGVKYTLYLDGKKIAFNLNSSTTLTQTGKYRLVCVDEVGNVSEYEFTLNYLSTVSIVLISVICTFTFIAVVVVLVLRLKKKIF